MAYFLRSRPPLNSLSLEISADAGLRRGQSDNEEAVFAIHQEDRVHTLCLARLSCLLSVFRIEMNRMMIDLSSYIRVILCDVSYLDTRLFRGNPPTLTAAHHPYSPRWLRWTGREHRIKWSYLLPQHHHEHADSACPSAFITILKTSAGWSR